LSTLLFSAQLSHFLIIYGQLLQFALDKISYMCIMIIKIKKDKNCSFQKLGGKSMATVNYLLNLKII
jgi:hypothetical protein